MAGRCGLRFDRGQWPVIRHKIDALSASDSNARRRVVITGMGVISPNGVGVDAFGRACAEGRSGVVRLAGIDTAGLKTSAAARVVDFDPASVMDGVELRRVPRLVPLALAASREALRQA